MNIEIEKRKINAKFQDPAFLADYRKFIADIKFRGENEAEYIFGDGASYGKKFDDGDIIKLLNKARIPLEKIIEDFYQAHGTDYADSREFLEILKETLRINIKSQLNDARISAEEAQPVIVSADIEEHRAKLLSKLEGQSANTSPDYIDFMIVYNEITTCSPEKLQRFIDNLYTLKQERIERLETTVQTLQHKLENDDFKWKFEKFETENRLQVETQILEYYKKVDIFEAIAPLTFKSNLNNGNSLSSVFVDKHIDVARFDAEITDLQLINNLVESIDRGLVSQNIYFDGNTIISKQTGRKFFSGELDITDFVANITSLSRERQTNFAYNPSYVDKVLRDQKYPIAGFRTLTEDETIENRYTIYSTSFVANKTRSTMPIVVKHIEVDHKKGTFSAMLYLFEAPDLNFGTQVYRVDKVPPESKRGTAKHKQTSGEVIETSVHVHDYNVFDRVIINAKKPEALGHGDVSTNFITDTQMDDATLEGLFNQKCNIDREPIKMVVIKLPEPSETQLD